MSTCGSNKLTCTAMRDAGVRMGKPPDRRSGQTSADIELCNPTCTSMPACPDVSGTKGSFGHFVWQQARDHGIQLFLWTLESARPFVTI